ncbi:MAG: YcbK family protein [Labilithrix sp.]|nr:YcbK family protein [Labilithrix sp.]
MLSRPLAIALTALTALAPGVALGDAPKRATVAKRGPQAVPASRRWHTATPGKTAPVDPAGRPMLVLQGLNIPDRVELSAHADRGGFSAHDADRAAHVMRDSSTGNEHPIDPRLLDMIYRLQTHFHAHEIRIISGYRTPRQKGVRTSNHGKGRAMDLVVPGASDEDVARFAREQGFAGVGIYPVSGFVHVDVRERSYFWVDTSGPGKRSRIRGILADLAQKSDAQALARGDRPVGPFQIGTDVDAALGSPQAPSSSAASASPIEEDEGDTVSP